MVVRVAPVVGGQVWRKERSCPGWESRPRCAFAQVNEAQLYVSMSRARRSMHLVTDCKEALREAVCRPSERISALELSAAHAFQRDIIGLAKQRGSKRKFKRPS